MNPDAYAESIKTIKPYRHKTRKFDLYYTYKGDSITYVSRGISATSAEQAFKTRHYDTKIPLFIVDVEKRELHKIEPVPVIAVDYAVVKETDSGYVRV